MGKTFLVIEDNKDDAELVKIVFRSLQQCKAALCRNLSEAKSYLRGDGVYGDRNAHPFPDAVLCDLKLAGEDAIDFLRWIKLDAALSKMPVYIFTGGATPNEIDQARQLGALEVIQKPTEFLAFKQMLTDLGSKLCA